MTRAAAAFLLCLVGFLGGAAPSFSQIPTGTIAGAVADPTGAALRGARVSIMNTETEQSRDLSTSDTGLFTAAALLPGPYRVSVQAAGFKRLERHVVVEAGTTTTVAIALELGAVTETVSVTGAERVIRGNHHQVGGVVTREQIDQIPLNGRSFLELAKIEPGVIPTRLNDGRAFVSALGAGLQTIPRIGATRVTVDGVNITTPGTAGVLLQVSPDVVQEFQIATVNFDAATSLTSNGTINIVTRSGTNGYRGTGFYSFRDDHLAAYPSLRRDPANPDAAFERHQFGLSLGGPVWKRRAFFFGSIERTDQTSMIPIRPLDEFAFLGGNFHSPYGGNQVSVRFDAPVHRNHAVFVRHTSDRNATFANLALGGLPSSWSQRINDSKQAVAGITSVLSQHVVNELRASHFGVSTPIALATSEQCAGCFGLGEIRTVVSGVDLAFGGEGTTSKGSVWRFQLTDSATWQIGSHTLRSGGEWEHTEAKSFNAGNQGGEITLFSPRDVRQFAPQFQVPAQFTTPADILNLPLKDFSITVGSGTVLWGDFKPERVVDLYRLYVSDTWRATGQLTVNGGLGWSYEPNAISQDLTKPALLAPIVGTDRLAPPTPSLDNFSTTGGFVWAVTDDGKTAIRGGAGRYLDPAGSTNALNRIRERELLSPLGTGTLTETGSNLLYNGAPLQFLQPTSVTGMQLLSVIPAVRDTLLRSIDPNNRDLSVRNLDLAKRGTNLVDPASVTPSSVHVSFGVQREVAHGLVVSADAVLKRFSHTFINGIDFNHWNSTRGSVLPRCTASQRADVRVTCSNGPLYFDTTSGRARYLGLLMRAEKRFSGRTQLLASYALASFVGSNGTGTGTSENGGGRVFGFNNDNWLDNYGPLPTDQRHVLNVSGIVQLPLQFALAVSVSAYSAPPFAPYLRNVDFNGDGTVNDLLPGTRINQFGRELGKDDLRALVQEYNQHIAGTQTPTGQIAPFVKLPDTFSFNDSFFTQDLRLTRRLALGQSQRRADVFIDVFNVFNTSNLVGFGSDLTQPASFGQPTERVGQVFGSGGSRAIQIGARFQF